MTTGVPAAKRGEIGAQRPRPRASQGFKQLVAWQRSMELVTVIYQLTARFPESERFGLVHQLRRSSVSIPSNIAEGQGRLNRLEFRKFLGIAAGSLREVETQLLISINVGLVKPVDIDAALALIAHITSLLNGLIRSLSSR